MNLQENIYRIKSLLQLSEDTPTNTDTIPPTNQSILDNVAKQVGVQYKWGGQNPSMGFDCSGLISYVTGLPRTTANGYLKSVQKIQNTKNLKPGDLIFFGSGVAKHVGIIKELDKNGVVKTMIHAQGRQSCPGNKTTLKNGQPDCVVQETPNINWYGNILGYGRVPQAIV